MVAPQLTVVPAPPLPKACERMRGTPTLFRWHPTRRRHVIRQQFLNTPAMIRNPGGHSRCRCTPDAAQTRVWGTKVIDRTNQIHPVMERQRAPRQRPPSTSQRCQPFAECGVEPLDVGGVDHPVPVRATPERLDAGWCAIRDAERDGNHSPLCIALHDLRNAEVAPGAQPRAPLDARLHRITKGLTNRPEIGAQAVGAEQERAMHGTAAHSRNEPDTDALRRRHLS